MKKSRNMFLSFLITFFVVMGAAGLTGCDYGHMYDQKSVKTYKKKMPDMDQRSIPVAHGYQILAQADAQALKNPVPYSKVSVARGRETYGYYCVHCHGSRLDGQGTVGQSFAPLPANLASPKVLSQSDGVIYARTLLGFKRHPALFSTVSADDAWAIIVYMRSMEEHGR